MKNIMIRKIAMFNKNIMKVLCLTLLSIFLIGGVTCFAANKNKSKIKIKVETINDGTGAKITVGKTGKYGLLRFYITGCGDAYKEYKNNDIERLLTKIETDGKKNEKYVINGLPEGTYSLKVLFEEKVVYEYEDMGETFHSTYYAEPLYSKTINFKISKGNDKRREKIKYDFSSVKKDDIIKFGAYEQDDDMTNGKEAIEWIVMSKEKDKILLLSNYVLDCLPYNNDNKPISWQNSTLRAWLNKDFYENAFNKDERKMIQKTKLKTYETETEDYIFLFSKDDDLGYFGLGEASKYARAVGTGIEGIYADIDIFVCSWYLRESWEYDNAVRGVSGIMSDSDWYICFVVNSKTIGIRPAMYLTINS